MSKGSPRIILRIPQEVVDQIEYCITTANCSRRGEPYDVSSWIRAAIVEKIAHVKRSRKQPGKVKHVQQGKHSKLTTGNELSKQGNIKGTDDTYKAMLDELPSVFLHSDLVMPGTKAELIQMVTGAVSLLRDQDDFFSANEKNAIRRWLHKWS